MCVKCFNIKICLKLPNVLLGNFCSGTQIYTKLIYEALGHVSPKSIGVIKFNIAYTWQYGSRNLLRGNYGQTEAEQFQTRSLWQSRWKNVSIGFFTIFTLESSLLMYCFSMNGMVSPASRLMIANLANIFARLNDISFVRDHVLWGL